MASRTRKRPHRGQPGPNVLVEGDTGIFGGPQGGAKPGASESGDLASREYGVPQADIPGGLVHLANQESVVARTPDKPRRPADYHKYHGVPSDDGQYEMPPGTERDHLHKPEPEPQYDEAVPVRLVQRSGNPDKILKLVTEGPQAIASSATVDPIRIADRDFTRAKFWICNETVPSAAGAATPGVRIGDWETTADGRGLLIPAASIHDFLSQDSIYLTNQSGTAITVSWGYETEVPAAGE